MYTLRSFLRTRFPQRPLRLGLVALVVAAYAALFLAKSLGLECIAEGVETAEQAGWLRREGCALAQGYHFARPVPPEQLRAWISRHASLPSSS